jgi:hypothetical protein
MTGNIKYVLNFTHYRNHTEIRLETHKQRGKRWVCQGYVSGSVEAILAECYQLLESGQYLEITEFDHFASTYVARAI